MTAPMLSRSVVSRLASLWFTTSLSTAGAERPGGSTLLSSRFSVYSMMTLYPSCSARENMLLPIIACASDSQLHRLCDTVHGRARWRLSAGSLLSGMCVSDTFSAVIVHSATESVPAYDGELLVQMSDLYHRYSSDLVRQYLSVRSFSRSLSSTCFDTPFLLQSTGMTGAGNNGVTQGNEPVPVRSPHFDPQILITDIGAHPQDSGTINGVGQWGSPLSTAYSNYTLSQNKTYRLRLSNTGSFASTRFSVDSHVLTVIEADGTPVVPYQVSGLVIDVAQRYSVLLTTNQTSGAYWMRSTVQQDAFTVSTPDLIDLGLRTRARLMFTEVFTVHRTWIQRKHSQRIAVRNHRRGDAKRYSRERKS